MQPTFAALADPTRIELLDRLASRGESSLLDLAEGLPITRQAVTKHLGVLVAAGLVRRRRLGRERLHELVPERLDETRQWLEERARMWDGHLRRLKTLLEQSATTQRPADTSGSSP